MYIARELRRPLAYFLRLTAIPRPLLALTASVSSESLVRESFLYLVDSLPAAHFLLSKPFSCNTYRTPRKCCKQKTYRPAKLFGCNTYEKPGVPPPSQESCSLAGGTSLSPILRTLFQVPYPSSPLFATLAKTAGVWGYSSRSGKLCLLTATRTRISLKFFLFTLLRTLWHTQKLNSFLFNRFRTLYPKTPGGWGYPLVPPHPPHSTQGYSCWLRIGLAPPHFRRTLVLR